MSDFSSLTKNSLPTTGKKRRITTVTNDDKEQVEPLKKRAYSDGALQPNVAMVLAERRKLFSKLKVEFQQICDDIIAKPEDNMYRVHVIINHVDNYQITLPSIIRISLKTLTFIFSNIIPGYSIDVSKENKNVQMTKEMKKINDFENSLVIAYHKFLKKFINYHEYIIQKYQNNENDLNKLTIYQSQIDFNCETISELLQNLYHFNHFEMLASVAIKILTKNDSFDSNKLKILSAFEYLFKMDESGYTTSVIVGYISKITKKNVKKITSTHIIDVLSLIKLNEDVLRQIPNDPENTKQDKHSIDRKQLSKKDKKAKKQLKILEKELTEVDHTEKINIIKKHHTQILSQVCAIYFRILKECDNIKSNLFQAALCGISKYGRLLRREFLVEIVDYIKMLINEKDLFSFGDCVNAINVLLSIVDNPSNGDRQISTDYKMILKACYNLLENLSNPNEKISGSDVQHFIGIINEIFLCNIINVNIPVVLAFTKRACNVCLHTNNTIRVELLLLLKNLFSKNPCLFKMLDEEYCAGKIYRPEIDDPEFCGADGTLCYEIVLLKKDTNPLVKKLVNDIILMKKV